MNMLFWSHQVGLYRTPYISLHAAEHLRPLCMWQFTDILASKEDWPTLYDVDVLEENTVPTAGVLYYEDMFVNFGLAQVGQPGDRDPGTQGGGPPVGLTALQGMPQPPTTLASSQETANRINGMHQWVTNEYLHCGIREAGGPVFERLLNLCRGGILPR